MSGPTAAVLTPRLTKAQIQRIEADLKAISHSVEESIHKFGIFYKECFIADLQPIGGPPLDGIYGVDISIGDSDLTPHVANKLKRVFGFRPWHRIVFDAYSRHEGSYRALTALRIHLVKSLGGLVDFGRALLPELPPELIRREAKGQLEWQEAEPYFQKLVQGLPGKVFGVRYEAGNEQIWIDHVRYENGNRRTWVYHVADATFLEALMERPGFYMNS